MWINFGSCELPLATARKAPIPNFSHSSLLYTTVSKPKSHAIFASSVGVANCAGSFARFLAKAIAEAIFSAFLTMSALACT